MRLIPQPPLISLMTKSILLLVTLLGLLTISGCATESNNSAIPGYRTARAQSSLELPPDLINTSNEALNRRNEKVATQVVLPQIEGLEITRSANGERWLEITADVDTTWAKLVDYTLSAGLPILTQSKQTAIIETDWIGDDSGAKSRILSFFGEGRASVNDKYTFWLERVADQQTALYVTHKQLKLVAKNRSKKGGIVETAWVEEAGDGFQALAMLRKLKTFFSGETEVDVAEEVILITTDSPSIIMRSSPEDTRNKLNAALVTLGYEIVSESTKRNVIVIRERRKKTGLFSKLSIRQKQGVRIEPYGVDNKSKITVTSSRGTGLAAKDSLPVLYRLAGELRK